MCAENRSGYCRSKHGRGPTQTQDKQSGGLDFAKEDGIDFLLHSASLTLESLHVRKEEINLGLGKHGPFLSSQGVLWFIITASSSAQETFRYAPSEFPYAVTVNTRQRCACKYSYNNRGVPIFGFVCTLVYPSHLCVCVCGVSCRSIVVLCFYL